MIEQIKKYVKDHQTEVLIGATFATVYGATIIASSAVAGSTAAKITQKIIRSNPIRVTTNLDTTTLAKELLVEMQKQGFTPMPPVQPSFYPPSFLPRS